MTNPAPIALPEHADFRFVERLRVRWVEVDMQRIVFNGHYLMYFDTAISGYWRALAMPYHETMERLQGDLFVRRATLDYEGSARFDEVCEVGMRCARIGNSSLTFSAALFRDEQRLVHGEIVYVFADPAAQASRPVPAALRDTLAAFEAGEPMLELQRGPWTRFGDRARAIRLEVLHGEQRLPIELAEDADDGTALHVLAVNRFDQAVATGRLSPPIDGVATLARLAVRQPVRGSGVGAALLAELIAAARERGDQALRLDALRSVIGFYAQAGFVPIGQPFIGAGRPHQTLQLSLR